MVFTPSHVLYGSMLVSPLGSGSAGNCYLFQSGSTSLLVDAGFGPRETEKRLRAIGHSLESIDGIVITHEHYDHIRGASSIAKKLGIRLFMTRGTLDASMIDPAVVKVQIFDNNTSFRVGDLEIHARRTLHDASDPSCFVVEAADGTRVGIASDLGSVDQPVIRHLSRCDALLFEANHDLDMLRMGSYPWRLKRRIMSRVGHLSNDDSMAALRSMIDSETKSICLIHLSEKNNHESIVRSMAEDLLSALGARMDLAIAQQRAPIGVMDVQRRGGAMSRPRALQLALF